MTYNSRNQHKRDALLKFIPETHSYLYGEQSLQSVTTLVESCFEQFDVDYWAPRSASKLGITEAEMRLIWERRGQEARTLGTQMHEKIENHYKGIEGETDETYRLFQMFASHYVLQPYRTEWPVFDEDLGVAGTIDFLEERDGVFTIFDWKRSDKLVDCGAPVINNRYGKHGKGAVSNLPDTAYWHYALQVSIYRFILERKYGINVSRCMLAVFHPHNPTYYVLEMPYLKNELHRLFGLG